MTYTFTHNIPRADIGVAVVAAAVPAGDRPLAPETELELAALLELRRGPLGEAEERRRAACRDILRNGSYKPTGRGKPASEYLLGAAREGIFPRVSGPVDVNNFISLKYVLPISLWDPGRCASAAFEFRLGRGGERYVFNNSGQEIDLADLVCGCELAPGGGSRPIVNPIKDGMGTKVRPETRAVLGAVFYPVRAVSPEEIDAASGEFLDKLLRGTGGAGGRALLLAGETKTIGL